ncbi:hypothetical protein BV20DRAFT_1035927 [Pilatotrama ljubarskyi]|nr:hypothetical protein BV20DRAFT_1035927 [Pilatotrama ljubarskyi]
MPLSPPTSPSSLGTRMQHRSQSPARSGRTSCESGHSHLRPTTPTSVHSSSSELGDNDIIPPPCNPRAPRTLVLCFDGTGDQFDSRRDLLKKDDRREQMVYYQAGIGTYTTPQLSTSLGQAASKILDEMIAWNLDAHVMSGYEFLMQNYEAGDKICLFGFSRGAYTARALAGMLHKVGLLPPYNFQQIPFAYKMYTRTDELGWQQSTAFKKAFSIDVDIDFIGVWDTVCSVGVIPHRLPFTTSNTAIRTFRHALSLDERRAKFKANYYNRPTDWESQLGTHPGDMPRPGLHHHARHSATKIAKAVKDRMRYASGATTATAVTEVGTTREKPVKSTTIAGTKTTTVVREKAGKDEDELLEASVTTAATSTTSASAPPAKNSWATAVAKLRAMKRTKSGTITTVAGAATVVEEEHANDADAKTEEVTAAAATSTTTAPPSRQSNLWASAFGTWRTMMRTKKGKRLTEEEEEFDKTANIQGETDVKEVWFAGCHCDVGGGSVPDAMSHSLARIPLRWMIRECFRTNTGIRFHGELLKEIGLDPATLWPNPQPAHEWPEDSFVYPGVGNTPSISLPPPQQPLFTAHVVAPTPMEKSEEEIAHAEKEAAKNGNISTIFPKPAPPLSASAATQARSGPHARDVSTSTAHTLVNGIESQMLVGTATGSALVPPGWGPDPDIDEVAEERKDARCKIYDELARRPFWWLLEFLPIEQRIQRAKDHVWEKHYRFNLGRGRDVPPTQKFLVHRSVKFRMEQKDLEGGPYRPRARWPTDVTPIYVD